MLWIFLYFQYFLMILLFNIYARHNDSYLNKKDKTSFCHFTSCLNLKFVHRIASVKSCHHNALRQYIKTSFEN